MLGDDEHVVARVVPAEGRSRGYIDGRLATAAQLAELGARTVDLHGQHAHQSLLSTAAQRDALDRFAGVDLTELRAARARLTEIDAALAALGGDARSRLREVDLLRFQLAELDAAELDDPDEDAALAALQDTLADAVEHRASGLRAAALLADDEAAGRPRRRRRSRASTGAAPYAALEPCACAPSPPSWPTSPPSCATSPRRSTRTPSGSPRSASAASCSRDLRRKYADSLAEVIELPRADRGAPGRAGGLRRPRRRAGGANATAAVAAERRAAAAGRRGATPRGAAELGPAVEAHLRTLAMPHAALDRRASATTTPATRWSIVLAANPGSPPLPLARAASGGELARTMLALRLVLSEAPDTLVFDEVDAGIGGAAALAVGEALAALGERHQVLVVTHLAQVAALADAQIVVDKQVVDGQTMTTRHARRRRGADRRGGPDAVGSGRPARQPATRGRAPRRSGAPSRR